MSYETDNLKMEVQSLKWLKADSWKLDDAVTKIVHLAEKITRLENELNYAKEKIDNLERITEELNYQINKDSLED